MKLFLLQLFTIISFFAFSQSKKVNIKLVQYMPYCGGAKPNHDLKNSSNNAVAYANKKLIVISSHYVIDTIITDKNGFLKKLWKYDTYKLYEPWKYYNKIPYNQEAENLNLDCLKEEWEKEDLKITVSKKNITIVDNIKLPKCPQQFPCIINKHLPQ